MTKIGKDVLAFAVVILLQIEDTQKALKGSKLAFAVVILLQMEDIQRLNKILLSLVGQINVWGLRIGGSLIYL